MWYNRSGYHFIMTLVNGKADFLVIETSFHCPTVKDNIGGIQDQLEKLLSLEVLTLLILFK